MGTTTFCLRHNDLKRKLSGLTKKELDKLDRLSPYGGYDDQHAFGWHTPLELHNGNVYLLVFWKGRLMRLEQAPENLNKKYYDKYTGKTMNIYEWTVLKRFLIAEIERLDNHFKKPLKNKRKQYGLKCMEKAGKFMLQ